jgi:hypothetical protein
MDDIDPSDLVIERFKPTGYRSECGIRITHVPTGLSTTNCDDRGSMVINKVRAMTQLRKLVEKHLSLDRCKQAFDSFTLHRPDSDEYNREYAIWKEAWKAALKPDKFVLHVPV